VVAFRHLKNSVEKKSLAEKISSFSVRPTSFDTYIFWGAPLGPIE